MTALAARVLSELRRLRLVGAGDRVVVALSGGPDSVALVRLMAEVLPSLGATLAGAAHLHHGLRGADADQDEAFCRGLAQELGIECLVERADAGAFAREHGVSIEVAGHRLRAALFGRARERFDAALVATGHTKNDVAETFLLRALRGAGLRGLGAIRASRPGLVRPLLTVSREEIVAYLAECGQSYREDASNRDTRIPRNRIRHELLPWLESSVSAGAVDALARAARLAEADDRFLTRVAARVAAPFVRISEATTEIDERPLAGLPLSLRRRVVVAALDRLSGGRTTAKAVDTVLGLLGGADNVDVRVVGGVCARLSGGRLLLERVASRGRGRPPAPARPVVAGILRVPGMVELPAGGTIDARIEPAGANRHSADGSQAMLDARMVSEPLTVRFRKPGDRVRPLGMAGHKKLQDVLVDRKVARGERDDVPLVVDASGRIVWVAGHLVAHEARVTSATTSVLLLKYRR